MSLSSERRADVALQGSQVPVRLTFERSQPASIARPEIVRTVTALPQLDSLRENKLSLVERLADDLAHEIKNPLHSMVINLEVLRRRLDRLETNEELLRYAGVLGSELERVNRRVDLLLRIARPNPLAEDLSTLAEVFEELREIIEIECDRRQVSFSAELGASAHRVRAPRAQARQVILTLALAVIDALPAGRTLCIRVDGQGADIRVHILGSTGSDDFAKADSVLVDPSSVGTARNLVQAIGGRVDVVTIPVAGNNAPPAARGFVVSLPGSHR